MGALFGLRYRIIWQVTSERVLRSVRLFVCLRTPCNADDLLYFQVVDKMPFSLD